MSLTINKIRALNVEASSLCTAKCPFCSRQQKVRPYGDHKISLKDFLLLPLTMVQSLKRVTFAGNFGDFSTNTELVEICRYLKEQNPRTVLGGDTNGMVQTESWWSELGGYYSDGELVFSIDGLEDTHALHRIGTNFLKVIQNLEAFIRGGGVAHWKFIVFEHNEHQIKEAAKVAQKIGCKAFYAISSRDYNESLCEPQNAPVTLKRDLFKNHGGAASFSGCKPIDKGSIYIAADGTVHPCCFAHCMYITEHNKLFQFITPLIEEHLEQINLRNNSLESILEGPYFREVLKFAPSNPYCQMKCSRYKKEVRRQMVLHRWEASSHN